MLKGHIGPGSLSVSFLVERFADAVFQRVARVKSEQELKDMFAELRTFPSLSGPYTCPFTGYTERPADGEVEKNKTSSHQRKMEAKHAKRDARRAEQKRKRAEEGDPSVPTKKPATDSEENLTATDSENLTATIHTPDSEKIN